MPNFGKSSTNRLNTCHRDIQTIMNEVVKRMDVMIASGGRTDQEQHELWKKGRRLISERSDPKERNSWVIFDQSKVVTYKDGYEKKSRHQGSPKSMAVDVVPYPTLWKDNAKLHEMAGVIKSVQYDLFKKGLITKKLEWGFDLWDFDRPHFQLSNK